SYACKRGDRYGGRHLRTTWGAAGDQFGLARNRCRTLFPPQRHPTAPSGQPGLLTPTNYPSRASLSVQTPYNHFRRVLFTNFFRQSRDRPQTNDQISSTQMGRNFTDASRELSLSGVYCSKGQHRVGGDSNGAIRRARERLYARQRTLTPVTRSRN